MTVGEKIKKFRKNAGLSQEQLAEKLCVSRQAITKWETDNGTPDINNLQCIAKLFDISVDSLLECNEDVVITTIREQIDLNQYQKASKFGSKYDSVVKDKWPMAKAIYPLIRKKKLSKAEAMIDFIVQPGVLQAADSLNDMSAYYLVETDTKQLLVQVTKTYIEGKQLNVKFTGKKCVIENNVFIKTSNIR
ncbi:helix-turn-helix domain-containing protein [Caproicibacterium sp. BJN0003]|uniref:helix-turn-helix domain-containing protein n=1 Tax=Caproicibacterium sp. BJN0003 TaxID=2994078 RepID=UPI002259301E|nr:helix-turn-helix transcriptional regulator [Caproicibacterium sp. BJN0003]UZT82594.1 helix-turn-helix transcriptional regulator [Caproicibacterium sp. BJN0003]